MSEPIAITGGFRGQVFETLHEIKAVQNKHKAKLEEMEQIIQSAASSQGIDLKTKVFDVDSMNFIDRTPEQQIHLVPPPQPTIDDPAMLRSETLPGEQYISKVAAETPKTEQPVEEPSVSQ